MLKTLLTLFKSQLDILYNKIKNKNANNILKTNQKSFTRYIYCIFSKFNKIKLYFFYYYPKFFIIFNYIQLFILHQANIKANKKKKLKKNNKKAINKNKKDIKKQIKILNLN